MADVFRNHQVPLTGPAIGAIAITPSDTVNLTERIRAVTIGQSGGALRYMGWDGVTYTTAPLPVGTYPLLAQRIYATGTTATGMTGWM